MQMLFLMAIQHGFFWLGLRLAALVHLEKLGDQKGLFSSHLDDSQTRTNANIHPFLAQSAGSLHLHPPNKICQSPPSRPSQDFTHLAAPRQLLAVASNEKSGHGLKGSGQNANRKIPRHPHCDPPLRQKAPKAISPPTIQLRDSS